MRTALLAFWMRWTCIYGIRGSARHAVFNQKVNRFAGVRFTIKKNILYAYTLKKSYKRPPHILSSSSESKIRSIKIHDHMNKPMSNSGSVSFCIPKCVILLTQTKHV